MHFGLRSPSKHITSHIERFHAWVRGPGVQPIPGWAPCGATHTPGHQHPSAAAADGTCGRPAEHTGRPTAARDPRGGARPKRRRATHGGVRPTTARDPRRHTTHGGTRPTAARVPRRHTTHGGTRHATHGGTRPTAAHNPRRHATHGGARPTAARDPRRRARSPRLRASHGASGVLDSARHWPGRGAVLGAARSSAGRGAVWALSWRRALSRRGAGAAVRISAMSS